MNRHECDRRRLVDAHFGGGLDPADERRLREHLPDCDDCRGRYERHLALAALDPQARSAEDRLARGLGIGRPRRRWQVFAAPALLAATAAALLWVLPRWIGLDDGAFRGRGGGDAPAAVRVYRIPADRIPADRIPADRAPDPTAPGRATPLVAGGSMAPDDELTFAYENPGGRPYLLVFAVDDGGAVYWYHPAWERGQAAPRAIAVEAGPDVRELPVAVRHDIRGDRLWIHAVFSDQPLDVLAVEALVAALPEPGAPLPIPGAEQRTVEARVVHPGGGDR